LVNLVVLSSIFFILTFSLKAAIDRLWGSRLVKSKYRHLVVVSVVINPLPYLIPSHFFLISPLQIFGPPVSKLGGRLLNDPLLNHLYEPGVVFGLAKLLNELYHVLRVRQIEALLRLNAALLECAEDDTRFRVLFLRRGVVLGEQHCLEEEPDTVGIEKAAG
jgi:hypothetical protein